MARELTNRVIIITGASSGIGAATAIACAQAGMDVVLTARREDRLREVAHQIEQLGRRATFLAEEVTAPGHAQRLLDCAVDAFGRFDVVFANAGYGLEGSVVDTSLEELRRIFDVNFFAAVELLQRAAKRLLAQRQPGHLLMCSSCLGKFTMPRHSAYAATKAAQSLVCRAMNLELRASNINVSSVYPITTTTEFVSASRRIGRTSRRNATTSDHTPRFFIQTPERVAHAIVRCLRRPKSEVWTSFIVRAVAAGMTLYPPFFDLIMGRFATPPEASDSTPSIQPPAATESPSASSS